MPNTAQPEVRYSKGGWPISKFDFSMGPAYAFSSDKLIKLIKQLYNLDCTIKVQDGTAVGIIHHVGKLTLDKYTQVSNFVKGFYHGQNA